VFLPKLVPGNQRKSQLSVDMETLDISPLHPTKQIYCCQYATVVSTYIKAWNGKKSSDNTAEISVTVKSKPRDMVSAALFFVHTCR